MVTLGILTLDATARPCWHPFCMALEYAYRGIGLLDIASLSLSLSTSLSRHFVTFFVKRLSHKTHLQYLPHTTGIALVASKNASHDVILQDISQDQLKKSLAVIQKTLANDVKKGRLEENAVQDIMGRIKTSTDLKDMGSADFVIEAATERTDLKLKIFEDLGRITKDDAILATNTSSISVTKIAAATSKPDKVIGMHFFNPVPVMQLCEVIRALQTSDETYQKTSKLARELGKVDALSKDFAGFTVNRILCPYINEAIQVLHEGIATVEDIDTTMKLGTNVPMGPLTLADFVGLDTMLEVMRILHSELGDDKYRPSPLLVKYVEAGWWGKKSGKGFYDWSKK